jgi:Cellulose biosynthesis protein BcsS
MMLHAAWKLAVAVDLRILVRVVLSFISAIATARAQALQTATAAVTPNIISPNIAVTSSFDADSLGNRSIYLDSTFAPLGSLYESGMRFRATGDASWYRFLTSEDPRTLARGHSLEGGLLAGYAASLSGFRITGLIGPVLGTNAYPGVTTNRLGAKAVVEMYAKPTDWTMASGSISYSTTTNQLQVQGKAGLRIAGDLYFGPEAKFKWKDILPWQVDFAPMSMTPVSPQTSVANMYVGAHISTLNLGPLMIGVSGGWAHDRQLGSGFYGSASVYIPF